MWCLTIYFTGNLAVSGLVVGLNDLGRVFQPKGFRDLSNTATKDGKCYGKYFGTEFFR